MSAEVSNNNAATTNTRESISEANTNNSITESNSHKNNNNSPTAKPDPSTAASTDPKEYIDAHDLKALSAPQLEKLEHMKKAILAKFPSHSASDYTYMRFLRARKFDVNAAVEMYVENLHWRKHNNIDNYLVHPPTEIRELVGRIAPESFHKFDKYGLPAYFLKAGKVNPNLLIRNVSLEDMTKSHIWGMEFSFQRAAESSARLGRNVDQFVNICDLQGLSMSHRQALKYIKSIAKLDNAYYPEALGKTYVINAPWIFPTIWNLVKGWIDPVTREKIHVLGSDYKELLLERFNPEDLPAEYGGKCQCAGGCIREFTEADVLQYVEQLEKKMDLSSVTIPAGKSHEITVKTEKFGGTLEYYFKSNAGEIGFTATFKGEEEKQSKIWQKHEKCAGKQPVKGSFVTDFPGIATFKFDNKHSW
jgi:hypothetical protein